MGKMGEDYSRGSLGSGGRNRGGVRASADGFKNISGKGVPPNGVVGGNSSVGKKRFVI